MSILYGPGPGEPEPLSPVPDMNGLPVEDVNGTGAGLVYGCLAEARSGLVRYLDVDLAGTDRHVLVPVGHVRIEHGPAGTRIRLLAARVGELADIPPYDPDETSMNGEYQHAVLSAHGRIYAGERYYAHPDYDHTGLYAGEHPLIRRRRADDRQATLQPLSQLPDLRVARGEPDVRDWECLAARGERAGRVDDLIVDPDAGKVRYLLITRADGANTALPVGFARIEPDERAIRIPSLQADEIASLPPVEAQSFDRETERRIRQALERILAGQRLFARPELHPGNARATRRRRPDHRGDAVVP